jgi:hypothetical protein
MGIKVEARNQTGKHKHAFKGVSCIIMPFIDYSRSWLLACKGQIMVNPH